LCSEGPGGGSQSFSRSHDLRVVNHHERLDGSGYPNGRRGEEIGLGGRIIAIADVVEAMSSHRPYRPGLGVEVALQAITDGRGTLFCTAAADACLHLFRDNRFTFTESW
jgi:HD-GYP domain-containing protein (c-di-GMP phosphodiesterase class II)